MITYIKGDLFEEIKKIDRDTTIIIPHTVNNVGKWGKGFVVPLGQNFPKAKQEYLHWYSTGYCINILDNSIVGFGPGYTQLVKVAAKIYVANMVGQFGVKSLNNPTPVDYEAVILSMKHLNDYMMYLYNDFLLPITFSNNKKLEIHCPKFGCGLGGGTWKQISSYIETVWKEHNVYIYELE